MSADGAVAAYTFNRALLPASKAANAPTKAVDGLTFKRLKVCKHTSGAKKGSIGRRGEYLV